MSTEVQRQQRVIKLVSRRSS